MKYPFVKMNILQYLVKEGEVTGYSFMQYCKKSGIPVSNGTIYPHLKDLEQGGLIKSTVDGKRKKYTLTEYGEQWIQNSTNASMPANISRTFIKLFREIDLAKWENPQSIESLICIVEEMKEALTEHQYTLENRKENIKNG